MVHTVYLVDDDSGFLESVANLLRAVGWRVEPFTDSIDFLRSIDSRCHGVIVLDLDLRPFSGRDLFRELRRRGVDVPVILLAEQIAVTEAVEAMKSGVFDVLLKSGAESAFLQAVKAALEAGAESRSVRERTTVTLSRIRQLTNREREVLDLVLDGHSSRRIGSRLGIEEKTVENHRSRLMRKIGVENVVQLTREVVVSGYHPSSS